MESKDKDNPEENKQTNKKYNQTKITKPNQTMFLQLSWQSRNPGSLKKKIVCPLEYILSWSRGPTMMPTLPDTVTSQYNPWIICNKISGICD